MPTFRPVLIILRIRLTGSRIAAAVRGLIVYTTKMSRYSAAHGDPSKRGKGGRASRPSTIKSKEEARRLSANKKKGKQAAKKMTMKEIMMHNLAMADKPYYINKLEKIGWKDP